VGLFFGMSLPQTSRWLTNLVSDHVENTQFRHLNDLQFVVCIVLMGSVTLKFWVKLFNTLDEDWISEGLTDEFNIHK